MLNVVKKWQSVLVVIILFASSFSLLASSAQTSMIDIEDASYDTPIGTIENNMDEADISKIEPSLLTTISEQRKGMVKIIVPTTDVSELYGLLKDYQYEGLIGDRVSSYENLAVPTLEVPISLVPKLSLLDSVIGVYEYPTTISKDRLLESMFDGENSDALSGIPGDEPMSVWDAQNHNLEQAWSDGYTGAGVIVGMPDSGVDFGHPDLRGTQARVPAVPAKVTGETVVALAVEGQDNATLAHGNVIFGTETIYINETAITEYTIDYATGALTFTTDLEANDTVTADYQYNSPYVGWPMAFDPASLGTYLDTGRANGTWYVNTSYNTTAITTTADVVIDSDAEWNTYLEITNEKVHEAVVDDLYKRGPFYLEHDKIKNCTLYSLDGATWKKLETPADYDLRASTSRIKLTEAGELTPGMILYAYYNYTNPDINEVLVGVPSPSSAGTPETMVVSGLTPGMSYSFAIKTKDEAGNIGDMSNSPMGTSGSDSVLPGSIVDLTVEASHNHSSVLMNWTAPGDDGNNGTVREYIVKYSTLPITNRVCFDYIDPEFTFTIDGDLPAGGAESRVISGTDDLKLKPGNRFYFAIVGVDEAGNQGELSNCPAPLYVKNDIYPPAAITDISVSTGDQHREVILTWTSPGDDGSDGTAMEYIIKYSMSPIITQDDFDDASLVPGPPTSQPSPIPQPSGNTETFVLTNTLTAGLTYYFAIEAKDEVGQQAALSSGPSLSAVAKEDTVNPDQITDLNAVPGPNHASVRLYWNATGDDAGVGQAAKYVIKYHTADDFGSASTYFPNDDSFKPGAPQASGTAENFVLENKMGGTIAPNTFYYFWIQAVDDGDNSGPASVTSAFTSATSTEDTTNPEAIVGFTAITGDNQDEIILSWTSPHEDGGSGGACKQYVIRYSTTPIIDEATFNTATPLNLGLFPIAQGTMEIHTISFPGVNTTLYFAIKGVDDAVLYGPINTGLPVSAIPCEDTTAPSTISNLAAATADNNGEINLNWDAPGDDGAVGTASSYIIKYSESVAEYKEVAFEKKQFGVINPTYEDVMYNVTGIPTIDGIYRLGIHPDPNLALANGMAEAVPAIYNYSRVLLVSDPSGFDMVYVDLDFDQDFSDEKPCFFGDEVAWAEWVNDEGDDEIRSGGMIYFISDGTTPIPYSDVFCGRYGLDNVIPADDEMICFFGEFGEGAISGTERASVIVGQGKMPSDLDEDKRAISQGIAPEAKIMAVTSSMFDGWYFAAEGYDGTPGTGDEAQIVSTGASIDVYECGWDFYSKFLDWLTYVYCDGKTSFVAGSGDTPGGGYGFGTINAPGASPAVITAGSGIDYYYRTGLTAPVGGERYDGGTSPGFGDIYPTSSRGPTMAGDPKPDIIATGAFTVSSSPINSGTGTDIWMGPGLASSTASGILALVHDAYFEATHTARKELVLEVTANTTEVQLHQIPVVAGTLTVWIDEVATTAFSLDAETGTITFDSNVTAEKVITATYDFTTKFPDVEAGRSILMSGADDMNYDPMSQGAGYCNAAESTKIAATTGGATVTPSRWTPGDYKGTVYDYFIKLYSSETKEENMKKEFTIENHDSFAIDAHVHAGVMEKSGETLYIVQTTETKQSSWTVLNSDGIVDRDGNMLGSINSTLWENAGLLKITATCDASEMDVNDDGIIDLSYALEIHDWTDRWDEGLSGLFDGDISPDTYIGGEGYWERNRFSSHFPETNGGGLQATIYNPANRSADGLLIWVRGLSGGDITWYVKCEFYEKSELMSTEPNVKFYEADGTTPLPANIPIGPGAFYNFIAEMVVPDGTRPGTYECAVYVDKIRTVTDENVIGTTMGGETVAWLDNKNLIDCTVSNSSGVIATTENAPWETLTTFQDLAFAMGDDGLIFNNIVPGSENVERVDNYIYEPVNIISSDEGQLDHGNVISIPELRKNGTLPGDNETVFGPSAGGEVGPYNLDNGNVINHTLYADISGEWEKLSEGANYTLDYMTGEITDVMIRQTVVNETTYTATAADEASGLDITFFTLGHTPLIDCTVYVDIFGEWYWLEEGSDYSISMATGQIDTLFGGVGEGWIFHTYYNHSLMPGITLHAYYNYSYSNLLNNPLDYTIVNETGLITFTDVLIVGDTVVANYSAGADFELYVDYAINHQDGDIRFTVPNTIDNESYVFPDPIPVDDPTWLSNNSFNLNYVNLLNCTLYFKNATSGLQEMTLSSTPANVSEGYFNYTINYKLGQIEFSKILVEEESGDKLYATWNLTAGDEIYAFYNYTALNLGDNIRTSYSYFTHVVDYKAGKISFTEALDKDDTLTATYTYKTTTTIPIVLNVAASDPTFEFGGSNAFDVSNEDVLMATGGETSAWLAYNNIVDGSCDLQMNAELLVEYGEVKRTEMLNNTNSVSGEIVLIAEGGETTADLEHAGAFEAVASPSLSLPEPFILYFNGTKMNGTIEGEPYDNNATDYTLNLTTGHIIFSPGKPFPGGLKVGANITADYYYYDPTITRIMLPHQKIVPDSYIIYENGLARGETLYDLNLTTGEIIFKDELGQETPVGLAVIEAEYKYGEYAIDSITGEVIFNLLTYVDNETFAATDVTSEFSLQNRNIAFSTSINHLLYLKNATHWEYMKNSEGEGMFNYTIDRLNGTISLNNWTLLPGDSVHAFYYYQGLEAGANIVADYQYRDGNKRLFNTDAVYGGGDWRFYYVDIPDGGLNKNPLTKFFVNLTWDNNLADVDVITFGPGSLNNIAPGDYEFPSERYGPYSLQNNGGSTETAAFFTATGGPQEYAMSDLSPGLNVVGLHSTLMTASNFESVKGQVGNIMISAEEIKVVSNEYSGNYNLSTVCSLDWPGQLGAVAAGPSAPVSYTDMLVYQDDPDWENYATFEEQLASGNTSVYVTLKDCLIFDVHIYGHDNAPDMDLGIFLDENGDGITQVDEFVAMDADWDADEHVKLIAPKDGDYIIRPFGFVVTSIPAHYDVDITIVQGLGFGVNGKGDDTAPDENNIFSSDNMLPAYTIGEVGLSWDLAGVKEGVPLMGAMYIGPGNGPMCYLMAIDLAFDFTQPSVSGLTPREGDVVNDKMPTIGVTFEDYDRGELVSSSMEIYLDGKDITAQSNVNMPFDDENAGGGFPLGTLSYNLPGPLEDGTHVIEASCSDLAGNVAEKTWSFMIDTGSPSLIVYEPSEQISYTNSNQYVISGEFEIDTTLAILGAPVDSLEKKSDGSFTADITLEEGMNYITISATDTAENRFEVKRTIILDIEIPEFDRLICLEGSITNRDKVTMTGEVSEAGTMTINSMEVSVNSDGTFHSTVNLIEGVNTIHLEFADMAGNVQHGWYNVTLDTVAPVISLSTDVTTVNNSTFELAGTVEGGAELFINGKRTSIGTRQSGEFSTILTLSHGINNIVIEAEDAAGNIAQYTYVVEYDQYASEAADVNWAAIGVMITLLVVGLVLGILFGGMLGLGIGGPRDETLMDDEIPPEDVDMEEIPEDVPMDEEIPEDEYPEEPDEVGEIPEEGEFPEEQPDEMDEELISDEDIPEEDELPSDDDLVEELPEEQPDEVDADSDESDTEPIPDEDIPEDADSDEPVEEPDEMDEELSSDEELISDEDIPEELPEGAEPIPDEEGMPDEIAEEAPEDEDPRIAKLRDAFEAGKISEELYEKNLARFKGE